MRYPDCPAWFTELDVGVVRQAVDAVAARQDMVDGLLVWSSETAARDGVLQVLEAIVRVATRRRPHPSADRQAELDRLHAALVFEAWESLASRPPTHDPFEAAVNARLATCPWWTAVEAAPETVPVPLIPLKDAAKELGFATATLRRWSRETPPRLTVVTVGPKLKFVPVADVKRLLADPRIRFRR